MGSRGPYQVWTPEEIAFLQKEGPRLSVRLLAVALAFRHTESAISRQLTRLGIRRAPAEPYRPPPAT